MSKNFKVKPQQKKTKSNLKLGPMLISGFLVFALVCTLAITGLGKWIDTRPNPGSSSTPAPTTDSSAKVEFEDENLKEFIKKKLNISTDYVTETQVKSTTSLSISGVENITSFKGLEKFVSMTSLTISNAKISDLSALKEAEALTSLYLYSCEVTDTVSELENITKLYMKKTVPPAAVLQKLTAVSTLELNECEIEDMNAFAEMPSVKSILMTKVTTLKSFEGIEKFANLETLSFTECDIAKMDGIDKAVALTQLTCKQSKIKDISSVAGAAKLNTLYMTGSTVENGLEAVGDMKALTTLDIEDLNEGKADVSFISKIKTLEYVCLNGISLSNLDMLSELKELKTIYAEKCGISDIDALSALTAVEDLRLSGNVIRDISALSGMKNLTKLYIANNISSLEAIKDIYSVEYLDISSNSELTELKSLNNWWLISTLYASDCSIKNVDLSNCTELTRVNLSGNKIEDISSIATLTQAVSIDISGNKIKELPVMASMSGLKTFIASENEIEDVANIAKQTSLTELDMSDNAISDVSSLEALTSLTSLNLSSNKISDVAKLAKLTKLTTLKLNSNEIGDISELKALTSLVTLMISGNKVSDITNVSVLTSLKTLEASGNKIKDISAVAKLTKLTVLDVSSNEITDISALETINTLTTVNLSSNGIEKIDALKNKSSMYTINLSNNKIASLGDVFSGYKSVVTVDLSNNSITDISSLKDCTKLEKLVLTGNNITDYSPIEDLDIKELIK